jgi:pimeloyl-ACP methyl ester carboxylesterase
MDTILIHGLGQGPDSWGNIPESLDGNGQVLCPDLALLLKEAGEPSYPALYRAFVDWCRPFPGSLALCGLSLGAVLALHYTLNHPDRVRALALIAPQYKMPRGLLKLQGVLFRAMPENAFAGAGLGKKEMISLTASMASLDFTPRLGELSCPLLVACGEKDGANKKAALKLAKLVPGARLVLVPGAGHEVNRQAPEALAGLLRDPVFLGRSGK